jgi:hypothetical protein
MERSKGESFINSDQGDLWPTEVVKAGLLEEVLYV